MANKRSRSTFETELTKRESPYALYGTPLPPLDNATRDDGSYVPIWQQEVRDERGRKRLHGAFTGGFSAGYFNTVGSKEGWTPQAFVSSRTNRAKNQQKVEDYMDEEDIVEAEEAKRLQTASGYGGVGEDGHAMHSGNALMDVMRPAAADSMGVKLLQKMGWRQGQGVGPKIRRKARGEDNEGDDGQTHLFAPDNSAMIKFNKKGDFKGLGYAGELSLSQRAIEDATSARQEAEDDEDNAAWSRSKFRKPRPKPKKIKPSFGVGVLNDTGSDDEDPYELGPKISYNRTIGGDNAAKKKTAAAAGGANPLLTSRPIFTSKKNLPSSTRGGFRKCHDGRLPLDGFVLAMQALDISPLAKYPPPNLPPGWRAKRSRWDVKPADEFQSTSDAAKASKLDPKSRAAALGEEALPGKSIFDFISPAARDKLAAASGNTTLPQGRGEDAPEGYRPSDQEKRRQELLFLPDLSQQIAREALQRGAQGWMPYADDVAKRARYRAFLEIKAGVTTGTPERAQGMSREDWRNELSEFAQAAEVFRPMAGAMASRFTSSRAGTYEGASSSGKDEESGPLSKPEPKQEDPAEQAAKMGMYGHMTRSVLPFYPTRLLCKRFNVRPPANVTVDPGEDVQGAAQKKDVPEMVNKKAIERMMQDVALRRFQSGGFEGGGSKGTETNSAAVRGTVTPMKEIEVTEESREETGKVNVEINEALEKERPGDAVFKAIFGSDDEDE